jgi:hypothetical protein
VHDECPGWDICFVASVDCFFDKNSLLRGLRIRKAVLYVKEILSQHIVLRNEATTAFCWV